MKKCRTAIDRPRLSPVRATVADGTEHHAWGGASQSSLQNLYSSGELGNSEVKNLNEPVVGHEDISGFKSRCTIPRRCAAAIPRAICCA